MNEMSTYAREFERKQSGEKRELYAPRKTMPPDIRFDAASTYASTFDRKAIPTRYVREREKAIDSLPFEGTSTSRADYPTHAIARRESVGPKKQYKSLAEDRRFDTEQRSQYYKKAGEGATRCPAAALVNQASRRKNGHVLFQQKHVESGGMKWEPCHKTKRLPSSLTGYAIGGTHKGNIAEPPTAEHRHHHRERSPLMQEEKHY